MKKFILLLLSVMLLCTAATAAASAKPYKNPNYELQYVKDIYLTDIDSRGSEPVRDFVTDENADDKVSAAICEAAGKLKLNVIEEPGLDLKTDKDAAVNHHPRELELRVTINHCGYTTVYVPGYYEDYQEPVTRYYYDKHGVRRSYTDYITKQRWVPDSTYQHAYLSLIYKFYDMTNGALVASFSDSRDRDYEGNAAGGMLNRSTRDCFNKIFKK